MQKLLIVLSTLLFLSSTHTLADHHSASFEARQDRSEMNVTSVEFRDGSTVITAEGQMGEYGKVYVTYELHIDASGTSGLVTGQGRGFIDENTVLSGVFSGIWSREGSIVKMRNFVNISDGSKNLDLISFDGRENTITVDAYIVE